MPSFPFVKPNDKFSPSASMHNATARMLNRAEELSPFTGDENRSTQSQNLLIDIHNAESAAIEIFSPVEITGLASKELTEQTIFAQPILSVEKATSSTKNFLLAISECAQGKIVKALVTGITTAPVLLKSASDEYVTVNSSGKLESTSSATSCRILTNPETFTSSEPSWCLLQLGVAAASTAVIPTFKIINVSQDNTLAIRIVHGSQSDPLVDHTCGYVYADTNYSIPAETLGVTPQSGTTPYTYIGLKTSYDTAEEEYVFELLALSLDDWQTLINTPGIDCLQLGQLVWSDGTFRIVQSLNIWNYDLSAKYWV